MSPSSGAACAWPAQCSMAKSTLNCPPSAPTSGTVWRPSLLGWRPSLFGWSELSLPGRRTPMGTLRIHPNVRRCSEDQLTYLFFRVQVGLGTRPGVSASSDGTGHRAPFDLSDPHRNGSARLDVHTEHGTARAGVVSERTVERTKGHGAGCPVTSHPPRRMGRGTPSNSSNGMLVERGLPSKLSDTCCILRISSVHPKF